MISVGDMLHPRRLVVVPAAVALTIGMASCGGGTSNTSGAASVQTSTADASREPHVKTPIVIPADTTPRSAVLAHVGDKPVTLAEVQHLMVSLAAPSQVPDPPAYAHCSAASQATPVKLTSSTPTQSSSQLQQTCRARYEELFRAALSRAIHDHWIRGESAELGLSVSGREVQDELDASKTGSDAEFEAYAKRTGRTIADMKSELEVNKLTNKIFEKIKANEQPVNDADVAHYYNTHRSEFYLPRGRTVRIVRTASAVSATRAIQEIRSGKGFARVAKELSAIGQPVGAKNGEVRDLKPGVFEEKSLNDAIFKGRLHHLYGPDFVAASHKTIAPETNSGFFIFEATRTTPAQQVPLAKAKAVITNALVNTKKEETLANAVAAYRRKWKSRTDCQAGSVVEYCKQEPVKAEAVDRYTL